MVILNLLLCMHLILIQHYLIIKLKNIFNIINYNLNIYKLSHPHIIDKLEELNKKGYSIVIISNQAGVEGNKMTVQQMEKRFDNFTKLLSFHIPVIAMIGKHSFFRKPCVGAFQFYANYIHTESPIEIDKSYYIGDAAGRQALGKLKKKDFSSGDYMFAQNIGLTFLTPDVFFENSKDPRDFETKLWKDKVTDPLKFKSIFKIIIR